MRVRSNLTGFTLVELMVVVVILGVLAAIAIPTFSRYTRRTRASEAMTNVQRIYSSQYTYNSEIHERGFSGNFVNAPATPAGAPRAAKYPSNINVWTASPEWRALGFALDGGHYFQYSSPGSPQGFTSVAVGDLDADGTRSTYFRTGIITAGEIVGSPVQVVNELE